MSMMIRTDDDSKMTYDYFYRLLNVRLDRNDKSRNQNDEKSKLDFVIHDYIKLIAKQFI